MMKTKNIVLLCCLILLNSCIVKSLQPFYTAKAISFESKLVGSWLDNEKGIWEIHSFEKIFKEENKETSKMTKEDKKILKKYKDAYYITYEKKNKEVIFIGMPFKIKEQLFIDFTPLEDGSSSNTLLQQHLLKTHSVAKIEMSKTGKVNIKWLNESKLKELYKTGTIHLKYEKVSVDEAFVLTASSEELYKFLQKYEASDIKDKWKSSDQLIFERLNAKP